MTSLKRALATGFDATGLNLVRGKPYSRAQVLDAIAECLGTSFEDSSG